MSAPPSIRECHRTNLVGVGGPVADVYYFHSGFAGGSDAQVGVFEGYALIWGHSDAAGGFEEDVGCGFAVLHIVGGDDVLEVVEEVEGGEGLGADGAGAAGGDGHGEAAGVLFDQADDGIDGADAGDEAEVKLFLVIGGGLDGEVVGMALVEDFDDLGGGDAGHFVEKGFGKLDAVLAEGFDPGFVMEGHGVGDGAVAVEDQAMYGVVD
jgi:hypothetical protein